MRLDDVPREALRAGFDLPLHTQLGLELTSLDPVTVELDLGDHVRSLTGAVHGGVLATLADVAGNIAAAASGAFDPRRSTLVTLDLHVRFLAQPREGRVRAQARLAHANSKVLTVECDITDAAGRPVARADMSSMRLRGRGVLPPGTVDPTAARDGDGDEA